MDVRPVLIDQINIGERQRKDVGDLANLADNIRQRGLLHPIVITRDSYMLMSGYRRLMACKAIGWTSVPCHFFEELSPREQFLIELFENEKRQNLSWEEKAAAIQKYHFMSIRENADWTQDKTADALGVSRKNINDYLTTARELSNPLLKGVGSIQTAVNTVRRLEARREADSIYNVTPRDKVYTEHPIQQADFNTWAPTYSGQPFNFIHCDFPYGINAHRSEGQNSALEVGYDDSPSVFWKLVETLYLNQDRIIAPSAHMIFWFSPNIYCEVWEILNAELRGFRWEEHPLIWMRGENEGIAPDPNRRPRRCYESCFFGWRGDRPIIKTKANIFQAPTTRKDHPHEKSELALRHFFEMCVDSNTRLLDPTCGSGSALRAARAITDVCTVSGLETNSEYVVSARRLFDGADAGSGGGPREDLLDSIVLGHEAGQSNGAVSGDLSG